MSDGESLSTRIANRNSHHAECHIANGNVPALRHLVDVWARDERVQDDRLQRFRQRLEEMEAIELEHGGFSLGVFEEPPPLRIRSSDAAARREKWAERASNLIALKGPEWWNWVHRPCIP